MIIDSVLLIFYYLPFRDKNKKILNDKKYFKDIIYCIKEE